jgi:selenocysteine lyase/cysteine desulfurase
MKGGQNLETIIDLPLDFNRAIEFPIVHNWTFLNHAAVAPISRSAHDAIAEFAHQAMDDAYLTGKWYARIEQVRELAAGLIGAEKSEIAFAKNTSEGIAFVASGLDWRPGDQVISTSVGYPTMVYPWMDLARRAGVEHVELNESDGRFTTDQVLAAITPRTRMVALSHVEFGSGFRHDIAAIGRFCRSRGVLLCVDAIQSLGVVPVDVREMYIDFLAADGHKWLLAPEGAAIFYCRSELLTALHPEIGWMNVVNANDFGAHRFNLKSDARRFECGSHNVPGILALGTSISLLQRISLPLIHRRVAALTAYLRRRLTEKKYRVISSDRPGETSGIIAFESPQGREKHSAIVHELEQKRIIIAERVGRLRASPHFYNTSDDIDRLVEALPD